MLAFKPATLPIRCLLWGSLILPACPPACAQATGAKQNELITAAAQGGLAQVNARISAHANVNSTVGNGITALMAASLTGHVDVVRALIDAGADVNASTTDGNTALMGASQFRRIEVVQVLIAAKADVRSLLLEAGARP
jgi:hypothetical protein